MKNGLPVDDLCGIESLAGDIFGRTVYGSPFEHEFMLGFDDTIIHSAGPGDVFRYGIRYEVLKDGGLLRKTRPTSLREETMFRFARAKRIMGVSWWNMNCHRTMDFVAGVPTAPPWLLE